MGRKGAFSKEKRKGEAHPEIGLLQIDFLPEGLLSSVCRFMSEGKAFARLAIVRLKIESDPEETRSFLQK